jgi:bacterioferritin
MENNKQVTFSTVSELRKRAREHILKGAVTPDYQGNVEMACKILNEALATEIVCMLRYTAHYYLAEGLHAKAVSEEFKEHASEEQEHANWLAKRIRELGGKPDFNPATLLSRSHAEYQEGKTLMEMVQENLIAERIAIESYGEMIRYFGEQDPTSRRVLEKILEVEEEHAEDMAGFLATIDPRQKPKEG